MSTYYYIHSSDTKEYFELTSGSWYPYLEDLYEVLMECTLRKKSYKEFIDTLKKNKTMDGFYDDHTEFITKDNEKYFLRPLFDWAYDKNDSLSLIDDATLYDEAVKELCTEKVLRYEQHGWDYSEEIKKAIKETQKGDDFDGLVDKYFKCVGKLNYDDEVVTKIGVTFEHAFAELKNGATIWRKDCEDHSNTIWEKYRRNSWRRNPEWRYACSDARSGWWQYIRECKSW